MKQKENTRAHIPAVGMSILCLLALCVSWSLFVGDVNRDEMIAGGGVVLASILFLFQIWKIETFHLVLQAEDIVQGWRIPWYIVSGVYEVVVILLQDLLGIRKAESLYRVSGFATGGSDPRQIGRRILATFYTTLAPNFIIIGIDHHQSRMLFHQLRRSSVPKMTKALGAQPGASRP